jgi:2-polyprenyl-3-methyl-5-hydroxy-6-metoxy-1,4-benzoquinol methylase
MGTEQSREFYDSFHSDLSHYAGHYSKSTYFAMFALVIEEIKRRNLANILEVGCGSGSLAQFIMDRTPARYRGFDFSKVAVERAGQRLGKPDLFYVGDARDPTCYDAAYDGIVCTEVLEHIDGDLDVIGNWRPGAICICSVPNFLNESHVRAFKHEDEVRARYGKLIDIESIRRVAKPLFRGTAPRQYLRQLRWSRNNPKRFLGLLGINTFEAIAGWFVFAGRRS